MNQPAFCPVHQCPLQYHEAGVSRKTGRAYGAFWTCSSTRQDASKCAAQPQAPPAYQPPPQYAAPVAVPAPPPDTRNRAIARQTALKCAIEWLTSVHGDALQTHPDPVAECETLAERWHVWLVNDPEPIPF